MMRRLSALTSRISTTYSVAALGSFLVFLVNGRYRTLLDRVLRLRLAPPTSQVSREVSFEYLNRQLVWHAFTEFLLFLLPLVGISRWRRWLAKAWKRTKGLVSDQSASGQLEGEKMGELAHLPERTCAICYQDQNTAKSEAEIIAQSASAVNSGMTDVTNPYEGDCVGKCVYCFVCLASRLESEGGEGWTCLRCGGTIKECKPWDGDVLPEKVVKEKKTVGFGDEEKSGMVVVEPVVDARKYDENAAEEAGSDDDESADDAYGDESEASGSDAYEDDEGMDDVPGFDE